MFQVMEAVFCRELEMKQAAEILGVSYGTLYGRYRDTFGCINRPYRLVNLFLLYIFRFKIFNLIIIIVHKSYFAGHENFGPKIQMC